VKVTRLFLVKKKKVEQLSNFSGRKIAQMK